MYDGYYQEDPLTNPEDPMPGAFFLNFKEAGDALNGKMYFTYVGCQTVNVGTVAGMEFGTELSGTWEGSVDGSPQSGPYSGTYDESTGYYSGVYSNFGGKQFKNIPGCISYYIAPNGFWEMFPVKENVPSSFTVSVSGATVSWSPPSEASNILVYILDAAFAESGSGNPVMSQQILDGTASNLNLAMLGLMKGREYICVVKVNDGSSRRIAFASTQFTVQ